jgi:hypothetical protein
MAARGRAYARSWSATAMAQRLAQVYAPLARAPRLGVRGRLTTH